MGKAYLIGNGEKHLVPENQPEAGQGYRASRRKNTRKAHERRKGKTAKTQHTGLPTRES